MSEEVGRRTAFEMAIDESPDDAARFAVLGDWLEQEGDPRGELIALMLRPTIDELQQRRLERLLELPELRWMKSEPADWRWGYLYRAKVVSAFISLEALQTLWRHPSLRFLRALTLTSAEPLEGLLAELEAARPRVLHQLEVSSPRPLELTHLPRLPLRSLSLHAPRLTGQLPTFPHLESLELGGLHDRAPQDVAIFATNPQLRGLTIQCFGAISIEHLASVLTLPSLERLALVADQTDDTIIDAVLDAPIGQRLRTLDLSTSGLTESAARRLFERVRDVPALSNLILGSLT